MEEIEIQKHTVSASETFITNARARSPEEDALMKMPQVSKRIEGSVHEVEKTRVLSRLVTKPRASRIAGR